MRRFSAFPEVVASVAVAHVELVANDREPHGVSAEEKFPVHDGGVKADIGRELVRAPAVPAIVVTGFGL